MTSSKGLKGNYCLIRRAVLLLVAALPGTVDAQSADQVRSVQNIFAPVGAPAELINH
jgi:hypothetical protein